MAGRGQSPFHSLWMRTPRELWKFISETNISNQEAQSFVWNQWYFGSPFTNIATVGGSISAFTISESPISGSPSTGSSGAIAFNDPIWFGMSY